VCLDGKQLSSSYSAYIVQRTTGYLVANNLNAPVYNTATSKFIFANASSDDIISKSYNFLLNNGLSMDTEVTTSYTDPNTGKLYDMMILLGYLKDASGTNEFEVVYTSLQEPAAAPAATDDSDDSVASSASVAAAAFAGLAVLILIVMSIVYCVKSRQGSDSMLRDHELKSNHL